MNEEAYLLYRTRCAHADVTIPTLLDPYRNMYHVERILFLGPLHPVDTPKCT
jgi:hypothetical protein